MRAVMLSALCMSLGSCASSAARIDASARSDAASSDAAGTVDAASALDASVAADAAAVDASTSTDASVPLDAPRSDVDAATPLLDASMPGEDRRDVIVLVGANHARYLSIDEGRTWCFVARATEADAVGVDNPYLLRNVSFHEGRFVSGSWRAVWVSENGFEWTDVTGDMGPALRQWIAGIAYGNGWWVATGGYGSAMRSRDLNTWENLSDELPGTEASRSLAFGAGMFVTARDSVGWWASTDGTGWTVLDRSAGGSVSFDGANFVVPPNYVEGRGIRLRKVYPSHIERAVGDGAFERVATLDDNVGRFAFGSAPRAHFVRPRVRAALADCLGLP